MTKFSKSKFRSSAGLFFWPLVILGIFALSALLVAWLWLTAEIGARFTSPSDSRNQIIFIESGFHDRQLDLYIRSNRKRSQFVSHLEAGCRFDYGRWSADGQVFVCSVVVTNQNPIMSFAYDFSSGQAIVPPWISISGWREKPESEWKKLEPEIQKIVTAHGGLSDQRIDDDMLRKNEMMLWFWQVPKS